LVSPRRAATRGKPRALHCVSALRVQPVFIGETAGSLLAAHPLFRGRVCFKEEEDVEFCGSAVAPPPCRYPVAADGKGGRTARSAHTRSVSRAPSRRHELHRDRRTNRAFGTGNRAADREGDASAGTSHVG